MKLKKGSDVHLFNYSEFINIRIDMLLHILRAKKVFIKNMMRFRFEIFFHLIFKYKIRPISSFIEIIYLKSNDEGKSRII